MTDGTFPAMDPKAWHQQPVSARKRLSERFYALQSARAAAETCPLPAEEFCVTCRLIVDERLRAYMRAIRKVI